MFKSHQANQLKSISSQMLKKLKYCTIQRVVNHSICCIETRSIHFFIYVFMVKLYNFHTNKILKQFFLPVYSFLIQKSDFMVMSSYNQKFLTFPFIKLEQDVARAERKKKVYKNKQNQGGEGEKIRSENLTEEKAQAIEELDIFLLF